VVRYISIVVGNPTPPAPQALKSIQKTPRHSVPKKKTSIGRKEVRETHEKPHLLPATRRPGGREYNNSVGSLNQETQDQDRHHSSGLLAQWRLMPIRSLQPGDMEHIDI
jgi:hypothetical protein